MKQIGISMQKSPGQKLFQSGFGQSVDVESIPADEERKSLELFRIAVRIDAHQSFRIVFPAYLRRAAAYRAGIRNFEAVALSQVFGDLGDDHVRLIDRDPVSDTQFQLPDDAHVVNAGPAHSRSLQFHRIKNGHRVDQAGPAGAPFHFPQRRLRQLVGPFKCDGAAREFGRGSQRFPVGDILVGEHQPIGRHRILRDPLFKPAHCLHYIRRRDHPVFHRFKPLFLQKQELSLPGIIEIGSLRPDQGKSEKANAARRRDTAVQLPDRTGA